MAEPNAYSPTWHAVFGGTQPEEVTNREAGFLRRVLPPPPARVLDACCGYGRHLERLARLGYEVTGIERDPVVADTARRSVPAATVIEADVHDLRRVVPDPFDALVSMWSSFGYRSAKENRELLHAMADVTKAGGRLVLDVQNRSFARHAGARTLERSGIVVRERTRLMGDRLACELDYGGGVEDVFSWEVFTPEALAELGRAVGLEVVLTCATFDERVSPSSDHARMQVVFTHVA